jgi:heme-degrading monooxygenase HmoA
MCAGISPARAAVATAGRTIRLADEPDAGAGLARVARRLCRARYSLAARDSEASMVARVTTYLADEPTDRLLAAFQDTIGPLQQAEGFSHAYFLVDSDTGKAVSMTIWESEDAMSASEAGGEQRRRERAEAGGAAVESVDHYAVGLIAVAPGVRPAGRRPEPVEEPGEDTVA